MSFWVAFCSIKVLRPRPLPPSAGCWIWIPKSVALRTLGDLNQSAGSRTEALEYYNRLQALDPGDDDLANLIERLRHAPEPVATETTAEPSEPASPAEPVAQAEPATEHETVAAAPPGSEEPAPTPEAAAEPVTSDFALDWTAAEPESQEALPGDLAGFAQETQRPEDAPTEAGAPFEEPVAEIVGFQSTFEEIVTEGIDTSAAHRGFGEPTSTSSEAEEAPLHFPFGRAEPEPVAEGANDPWGTERGQPVQPWGVPPVQGGPQSGSSTEAAGADAPPVEPWADLPPTVEAPEGGRLSPSRLKKRKRPGRAHGPRVLTSILTCQLSTAKRPSQNRRRPNPSR
jgi:hypothetical protein